MTENYKSVVLSAYKKKRAEPKFSLNLLNPAPARLRDECLKVYEERHITNDDEILKLFFGAKDDNGSYFQIIRNFDVDKFRPLVNFIKGNTSDPEDKNVELLAWLINFENRPFHKFNSTIGDKSIIDNPQQTNDILPPPPISIWKKLGLTALLMIVVALLGLYIPSLMKDSIGSTPPETNTTIDPQVEKPSSKSGKTPETRLSKVIDEKQCMFWNQDHYEAIACNQEVEGASVIALNQRKLTQQKKITNLDTIGRKDIGRTWYFKIDRNNIDLFTDSGSYPLDEKRVLRPLTIYMLNKYILSKR